MNTNTRFAENSLVSYNISRVSSGDALPLGFFVPKIRLRERKGKLMITSTSNQRIKNLTALVQKAKARKEEKVFIVEGVKMFKEAPRNWIKEVYVSESFLHKYNHEDDLEKVGYEVLSDEVFAKVSDTKTPQGILSILKQPEYTMEDLLKKKNPLLVILEDIQDPGNLGTILRAGEGAGIDGVIMTNNTADIFNPKVIRSTMGSIYRVPFVYTSNILETISSLKNKNINCYAAHLKDSVCYDEPDYKKGTAFIIGNEGNGLKQETADLATSYIKIPMEGKVESLNAAIATSILMYEASKQRRL